MKWNNGGMATVLSPQEVQHHRQGFPFFANPPVVNGKPLAYLDSGATSQRPARVLDAERDFLERANASVHRGASVATGSATEAFEGARQAVAGLVGAQSDEIVWTMNATDALNVLAQGIAEASGPLAGVGLGGATSERFALSTGDEILVTEAEHHANLIPWQRLALRTGATLKWIPVNEHGTWSLDDMREAITERTKIVAFAHVSNVTGFVAPVAEVAEIARERGALTVLDACQSVPHIPVNLADLGVDFAVFSGHKMLGPNGIGVLYGKAEHLAELPPARTGGSSIMRVTMEETTFLPAPLKFEAGTQPVSQVIGLGEAARYLAEVGMPRIEASEAALVEQLVDGVQANQGLRLLGSPGAQNRVALASVEVLDIHAHDVGQVLDGLGVQVRVGHHCAQPLHRAVGMTASVRASVHLTTTPDEIDRFLEGLREAQRYFGVE